MEWEKSEEIHFRTLFHLFQLFLKENRLTTLTAYTICKTITAAAHFLLHHDSFLTQNTKRTQNDRQDQDDPNHSSGI